MKEIKALKGFSLAEMIVSISIIIVIASVGLASYRKGVSINVLNRSGAKAVQDLRRAQNLALTATTIGGITPDDFGIYFNNAFKTYYIIFADKNDNKTYDPAMGEEYETVNLEADMSYSIIAPSGNTLSIAYLAPDPTTFINGLTLTPLAQIRFCLISDNTQCRNVTINNVGLVDVQ